MRRLGLIGGMSWESTLLYYRALNQGVAQRLGGLHSAELVLHSVDFGPIAAAQARGDWVAMGRQLGEAAQGLRAAGAQGLVIATNTMHKVAAAVESASGLPLLHIADPTARAAQQRGARRIGLLGTRFTMEDPAILADRWRERFDLEALVPDAEGRAEMHRIVYDELCRGVVDDGSRQRCCRLIEQLAARGADAVAFSCTEITMLMSAPGPAQPAAPHGGMSKVAEPHLLMSAQQSALPVLDSTALHAAAAVDWMLDP